MVLKLYGAPMSSCTRRVAVVLSEKNVPYEMVPIDIAAGQHKSAEFKAKQPFGQVPYIVEDDGFTLFESRAIGRYIATKYAGQGNKVLPDPADVKKLALYEQAASIELSNFDPFVSAIVFEKVIKQRNKGLGETDTARVNTLTQQLSEKLDAYEVILSKQKYLAGDEVTIADLFHLTYGSMLAPLGINALEDAAKRPNVARWWKDITSRSSWDAVKNGA